MIRFIRSIAALALAAACCACSEREEIFYSTRYDVVRVDAAVVLAAPDEEPADDGATDDNASDGSATIEALRAEVLAAAPVAAGGSYALDFLRYDGGPLRVVAGAGGEALAGEFTKQPGSSAIRFAFGDADYTATLGHYTDDGRRLTLLAVDLTELLRERHPDLAIRSVVRNEYTSTPYR